MPFNRKLYPPDWEEISRDAKERAGWRCEGCGVRHGAVGFRDKHGAFTEVDPDVARVFGGFKVIKIILTTGHVDHDPQNNDPSNLRSWCQQCHNRHDASHRRRNASHTRALKRAGMTIPMM
jgi:hypothetical protein